MKRLLVIDDDAAAVDGLRQLLSGDGYDVVAKAQPDAALAEIQRARFDAVITDLEMPHVHGVEVVRAARAAGTAVVIVISAYTDSPAAEEAQLAGAARVFGKPLDYDTLADDLAARLALAS